MENENITSESLTGGTHVESSVGGEAVGGVATSEPSISLSKLKETLGKDYRDADTALKSIKDTFSFVGKAGQLEKELQEVKGKSKTDANSPDLAKELQGIKEELWYTKNPQFAPFKDVISKTGKAPDEVVSDPVFKDLFSKVQGYEESQKLKTVLQSNPRLAASSDKLSKAVEAANLANKGVSNAKTKAAELATEAVMEAYDMK